MTNSQTRLAAYLKRSALRIAREAQESFEKSEYDRVVRKTQESVELFIKALLLAEGIEPVKTHDLVQISANLTIKLSVTREDLDFLTEERIPAFYGAADFVPDEIYDKEDGERCLKILREAGLSSL